ncbi:MAG: glutamate racemase [Muribaculaceae bacterium]|nr:glutamate racemase [Muribaculaceae bacterium]
MTHSDTFPIGIFDSGYGGLTILDAIRCRLPEYSYLYLGDNARAPYGIRSFDEIYRFTLEAVRFLFDHGCRLVILACNTASAKALRSIQQKDLPKIDSSRRVLGVIRPTVEQLGGLTSDGRIGLFATPGTVASGSYDIEIAKLYPSFRLYSHACPSWVEIVEAGKADSDIADEAVKTDVEALFAIEPTIDTIILGCTHYPLLLDKVEEHVAGRAKVVTQGQLVAESLADYLRRHPEIAERCLREGDVEFLTTGPAERFDENASLFLGHEVAAKHCEF